MTYFFQLPQYFARQILADILALFSLLATPAAGQFLSDGVTPVTPIPNSNATLRAHFGSCLAEQPVTGLCTTLGDNSGFGAIPSWDVSNVNNFDNAFNIKTTFNGDVSRWDMSNATSLKLIFGQAYVFNQDISRWDVSNVTNFDGAFYATGFNQDVSGWNVTSGTNFNNMFQQSGNFNQDIRKWDVRPGASFTNMFLNTTVMTATYGTHPYYSQSPRREFFYAADVETLESVEFPTEPSGQNCPLAMQNRGLAHRLWRRKPMG